MGIAQDTYTLFIREMMIFRKNIGAGIGRAIIFPALFIFLLGSFGSAPKNVPVAVVNYDNTISSLNFTNLLQQGNNVQIVSSTTQQAAMAMLSQGSVAGVIVIPNGFASKQGQHQVYVYLDNSQPQSAAVVDQKVTAVAQQLGDPPPVASGALSVVTTYTYGASSNYLSTVVGGIVVMVAAFGSIFGAGFTVLSDRELGNLKAFLTTPINKFSILLSKVASGTFQSMFSAYVGLGLGLLYGATITAGIVGFVELLWIILLVGLGFSALAVALASKVRQIQTYALAGQSITMPAAFMGGSFVPITLLPAFLLPIAAIDPLTYAVYAVKDIMVKGSLPISGLLFDSGVLLLFTILMLFLAFMLFKDTSEQL